MNIKVNKRKGKFHVVENCWSGAKYIHPKPYDTREPAAALAKKFRADHMSYNPMNWKKEMQTF